METVARGWAVALVLVLTLTAGSAVADELVLFGAGSLREAMTQITRGLPGQGRVPRCGPSSGHPA